jgi:hypothetical protein
LICFKTDQQPRQQKIYSRHNAGYKHVPQCKIKH